MTVDSYRRALRNDGVINNETKVQLAEAKEFAWQNEVKYFNTGEVSLRALRA